MGLINWIFDFYQQYRIDQLRDQAAHARSQAASIRGSQGELDVERLERALGELALARPIISRSGISERSPRLRWRSAYLT